MSVLVVIEGPDVGKVIDLTSGRIRIGRDEANDVVLNDPQVSRQHAEIVRRDDVFQLVDLESRNGTFVNGVQAGTCRLAEGDEIRMGRTRFRLQASAEAAPPRPGERKAVRLLGPDRLDATIRARQESTARDTDAIAVQALRGTGEGDQSTPIAMRNLRVLYRIASALSNVFELDILFDKVLETIFGVLPAERGFIAVIDPVTGVLRVRAVRTRSDSDDEVTISHTIANYVIQNEQGVLTSNAMSDDRFGGGKSVVRLGIRSAICVPMRSRRQVLGVIGLDARASTTTFTEADLNLMTAIGNQVGLVVENAQLVQDNIRAERLAAVGEAVANLSHYIKNILQGLQGGSTLIETGLDENDPPLVRRGFQIVDKSQRKVAKLVKDMLSYAGPSEPNLRPADLNALLEEIVEFARTAETAAGVTIECRFAPDLPPVMLDPDALNNCVLNILLNAFDAVAGCPDPRVVVRTDLAESGERVRISVTDNGVGIPAARLPGIFNALSTTKGGRGTGLGLAVARKIAVEHGGEILVASEEGRGSTFTIVLPVPTGRDRHCGSRE